MTAKYISASLPIVLRILEIFTPRFLDLMTRICTMTSTKTAISTEQTGGSINGDGWVIRESDDMLTEAERQGYLSDCQVAFNLNKTKMKGIQRDRRICNFKKSFRNQSARLTEGDTYPGVLQHT